MQSRISHLARNKSQTNRCNKLKAHNIVIQLKLLNKTFHDHNLPRGHTRLLVLDIRLATELGMFIYKPP